MKLVSASCCCNRACRVLIRGSPVLCFSTTLAVVTEAGGLRGRPELPAAGGAGSLHNQGKGTIIYWQASQCCVVLSMSHAFWTASPGFFRAVVRMPQGAGSSEGQQVMGNVCVVAVHKFRAHPGCQQPMEQTAAVCVQTCLALPPRSSGLSTGL